ncbi:MAG: hypothetical protein EAS48_01870 [Chryseobacterium sp.]|nr:MAG: hypothetical protein EAS48_01870 [Chryseobacterium sp.]
MKKIILAAGLLLITTMASAQTADALPQNARVFIKQHYPGTTITKVESKLKPDKGKYKVKLSNGAELEFDARGRLKEIEGSARVPERAVPASIRQYINSNFRGLYATELETKSTKHKVKLSDGTKLEFTPRGKVMEIESKSKLPDQVVPVELRRYVAANYSGRNIIEWELKINKQKVKLSDGTKLEFSRDGKFLKVD